MSDMIHIEPAHEQRPAFAAWGLAQTPALQTASATGWDIPLDLYPSVPTELLAGAYVDGFPYDRQQAQPVKAPAVEAPAVKAPAAETKAVAPKATRPRKRAPRKTPAKKAQPITVAADDTKAIMPEVPRDGDE